MDGNLQPGSMLVSRYRIDSVLGEGGMGAVYLAHLATLEKPVAIKEMRVKAKGENHRQQAIEQFQQEARFLANLDHPHLVDVSDYFEDDGRYYLVMTYIPGQSLAQLLKARQQPFPMADVLEWAFQLLSALEYLHSQDPPLLFRDLKPANIMLDTSGKIRLVDFGIARLARPDQATVTFLEGVGSPGYAPLEQYHGAGETDQRSDIYSLGATLFHLLTNQLPPSAPQAVSKGLGPPSARQLNGELPVALDTALKTMMAITREERFQNVGEVRTVLESIVAANGDEGSTECLTDTATSAPGHAYLRQDDRCFPLLGSDLILGRQSPAQLVFSLPQISRQHLRLIRTPKGFTVADLESRFGSFLNGVALGSDPVLLQDGDELVLAGVLSLIFFDPSQTQGGVRVGRLKGVWIDPESGEAWLDGSQIVPALSVAQLSLLKLLEARAGTFVSREEIVAHVWPTASSEGVSEEAIDGLIKRVRGRLREAGRDPIESRRGQGLRLLN